MKYIIIESLSAYNYGKRKFYISNHKKYGKTYLGFKDFALSGTELKI